MNESSLRSIDFFVDKQLKLVFAENRIMFIRPIYDTVFLYYVSSAVIILLNVLVRHERIFLLLASMLSLV